MKLAVEQDLVVGPDSPLLTLQFLARLGLDVGTIEHEEDGLLGHDTHVDHGCIGFCQFRCSHFSFFACKELNVK